MYAAQRGLEHRKADKQISVDARKYYKNINQLENIEEKDFGRTSPLTLHLFLPMIAITQSNSKKLENCFKVHVADIS